MNLYSHCFLLVQFRIAVVLWSIPFVMKQRVVHILDSLQVHGRATIYKHTAIGIHIHIYSQFRITSYPNKHGFGLFE